MEVANVFSMPWALKCFVTAGVLTVAAVGQGYAETSPAVSSETDRISYSLGYQIGGDFKRQAIKLDPETVVRGILDGMAEKAPLLSDAEMKKILVALKSRVVADEQMRQDEMSRNFLASNLKKPGVEQLPGGAQYRVIVAGNGPHPTETDTVEIHFRTSTAEGIEVSDTYKNNQPKRYQVASVAPALKSALPLMRVGGRSEVVVPPGHGGKRKEFLEKRGILIYEIELLSIVSDDKKP